MIPSADAEIAVGISWYATGGTPCKARVKSTAEDFGVEEQIADLGLSTEERASFYPLYRVEKNSIDTMHMARTLGGALRSRVSYGGLKDKKSVSIQYATPTSLRSARPSRVVDQRFTATLVGYVPRPLSRDAVIGNRFAVVLRECCPDIEERAAEAFRLAREGMLPNFYGLQRFGASGPGTHGIGRAILRREFEEAVRLVFEGRPHQDDATRAAREAVAAGRYEEAIRLLPEGKDVERGVARELSLHPGAWIKALRAVPVKLRRLYVHAYQSLIFNKSLSKALEMGEDISKLRAGDNWAEVSEEGLVTGPVRGVKDLPTGVAVPMVQVVGYAYRDYGSRFDACTRQTLEAEGIAPRQFYVEEMQEVSAEGGFRRPHLAICDASLRVEGETARLSFTLAKGQYATVLLREIIKPDDPEEAGLA